MFIKINPDTYIRIENILSIERITNKSSDDYDKWKVLISGCHCVVAYIFSEDEIKTFVSDINNVLNGNKGIGGEKSKAAL